MEAKIFVAILLLAISIHICVRCTYAKEFYDVIPQQLKCSVLDSEIVHNFTCTSKPINRTCVLRTRDIHFQPAVNLTNYHISMNLFRKFGKTFRPFFLKMDHDVCSFFSGIVSRESSLLKRTLDISDHRKNGNFYDPCPISGRRYEIDFRSDFSKLPDIIQPGEYRTDSTGYTIQDGIRKDFMLTQSFIEIRSKVSKNNKN